MTEISAFKIIDINTATIPAEQTFGVLNVLLQKILKQKEQDIVPMSELAVNVPDKIKVLNALKETKQSEAMIIMLPLKLLSEGLKPTLGKPKAFKFVYKTKLNIFQDVKVYEETTKPEENLSIQNSVQAANSLFEFMQVIDNNLSMYEQILSEKKDLQKTKTLPANLKLTFDYLGDTYLPKQFSNLTKEYNLILSGMSLANFEPKLTKLSNLLQDMKNIHDHKFYTLNAVNAIISESDLSANTWLNCVNELLPENLTKSNAIEQAFEVLYNYMVGYYVSNDMCKVVTTNKMPNFSFSVLLRDLISNTTNATHKLFFEELLTNLTSLCTQQTANENVAINCQERMVQSQGIMNQVARLCKMLNTLEIPKQNEKLSEVPTSGMEMLAIITTLKEFYSVQTIPGYKVDKEKLNQVTSYMKTVKNLALLSLIAGGAYVTWYYGGDIIELLSSFPKWTGLQNMTLSNFNFSLPNMTLPNWMANFNKTDYTQYFPTLPSINVTSLTQYLPNVTLPSLGQYLPNVNVSSLGQYLPSVNVSSLGQYVPNVNVSSLGQYVPTVPSGVFTYLGKAATSALYYAMTPNNSTGPDKNSTGPNNNSTGGGVAGGSRYRKRQPLLY